MSEATEALGIPASIVLGGKTYRFAPMDTVEVVANYECYLEEQAWLALERAKKHLTAQDYKEQGDGIRRDVVTGIFGYGSPYWFQTLQCLAHQKKLLHLMATFHDRDVTMQDIEAFYKDPAVMKELARKVFGAGPSPNAPPPATAPATGTP